MKSSNEFAGASLVKHQGRLQKYRCSNVSGCGENLNEEVIPSSFYQRKSRGLTKSQSSHFWVFLFTISPIFHHDDQAKPEPQVGRGPRWMGASDQTRKVCSSDREFPCSSGCDGRSIFQFSNISLCKQPSLSERSNCNKKSDQLFLTHSSNGLFSQDNPLLSISKVVSEAKGNFGNLESKDRWPWQGLTAT